MPFSRRHFLTMITAQSAAALIPQVALAATPKVYAERGIAVDGTDVVAYFTQGAPTAGNPDITHTWNGVVWRFSNTDNRDAFATDPEKYAPQYGGYCAYAVSEGYTASTTPEAWRIENGKLYLNYSRRIQRRWERDIPGRITAADANWPDVLK